MPSAAFISDIHANLEALTAVLEDIDRHGYEEIYCLGDVVGYGPDPVACTDIVRRRARATIMGNHDEALVKGAWGFNQVARSAMEWTKKQLRPSLFRPGSRERWRFLADLPLRYEWQGFLLVHGSPREPTSEYILPRDAEWSPPGMFQELFSGFESVCLVGHTHVAGVFEEGPRFTPQSQLDETFRQKGGKMIVNVGSVGQPRDHDWRACYLSVEDGVFRFHRVEYPVAATREKIRGIADLDNRLGDRLDEGV
jgi:diadenosine tetraphosphatase ApaH/serine/threonine PP2A family protein phosphatase